MRTGGVAAGHPITAAVAMDVLRAGGCAADAAVAALMASWVSEPCMSSAGGGAFALAYDAASGKSALVDGFCQAPRIKRPLSDADFFPIEVDFGDTVEPFHVGYASTAVPGSIACAFALHERWGTMPMRELVQPAIALAREGVQVHKFQRYIFELLEPILRLEERGRALFFREGKLIEAGEKASMPQLADFLDFLCREGPAAFYQGEVARKIAEDYQARGGHLQREDFEHYQAIIREPLAIPFCDKQVLTNPPPSIGGISIGYQLLGMPERAPHYWRSPAYVSAWLEVQKEAWRLLQSPDDLRQALAAQLAARLGSTTHISLVDAAGNAVGLTTTNGEGSGYFVANTDIQLNNMLGEAALLPGGFHSWPTGQRLLSMMAPTFVQGQNGQLEAVLGSGGAGRIATALAQTIYLLACHQLPVGEAIAAPRLHLDDSGLNLEPGFEGNYTAEELEVPVVEWKSPSLFFGGVNGLARQKGKWLAASDGRRDGAAMTD